MSLVEIFKRLDAENLKDIQYFVDQSLIEYKTNPPMKKGDVIRASSINNFCPRLEVIKIKNDITLKDEVSAPLRRIFNVGRAYERYFRDEVLGNLGIVIGRWKCLSCHNIPDQMGGAPRYKKPTVCPKCGGNNFSYSEEYKLDESCLIAGHCDGFVYWGKDYSILEAKTVNDARFKQVKKNGPFEDHLAQTNIYMRLFNYQKALIWYFNKNSGEDLTFWINHDTGYSYQLFKRGYAMQEFWNSGVVPERICVNGDCPKAKGCPLVDICFGELK